MYITYGTKTFTKFKGYYGNKEACPRCGKTYSRSLVINKTWVHILELPLIPVKTEYVGMCPICAQGYILDKNEGKALQSELHMNEDLTVYGKDVLSKHQKGMFKADTSKELWVKDNNTGEEILVADGISGFDIKLQKKTRGLKKIPVMKVND